ncbi:uncharacterized protein CTHT_0021410 [Thermochaetoides thermophila DSM 1495]|uniref:Peptidase A1 domain-containing protein n=1 Tax=Chaetomium thermophilum (strain DSM 1495 / CBS 144.50 / IMI 039719) TaxID=759272 RepID=G0S3I8_CHATD|nr:hypothetical protein CTHT_0021410 [Thermochaetoides thermophila DSM 1495]EGS20315.1 hypothetical protein CTHT_0021410 [Thermochaetoides thermophila DSM 1495]
MSPSLLFFFLSGLAYASESEATPKQFKFTENTHIFGADGPWHGVEVSIGDQPTLMIPGRSWESYVITTDYCKATSGSATCEVGAYDPSRYGKTVPELDHVTFFTQNATRGIKTTGTSRMVFDSVTLDGVGTVPDHTLALIENESQMLEYPNGKRYPIMTGCLSLGSLASKSIFWTPDQKLMDVDVGNMIAYYLAGNDVIPSASYGFHYGSALPSSKIPGSLIFGGYDRNRVIGRVDSQGSYIDGSFVLRRLAVNTFEGSAPFEMTGVQIIPGTYKYSTDTGISVRLDACSPYLTLPSDVCKGIASYLPIYHHEGLDLWLWNTSHPGYKLIVESASALTFDFDAGERGKSTTIHLPLMQLNLTLGPPFTGEIPGMEGKEVPYFPCHSSPGHSGAWVLGRPIFQSLFIGANFLTKQLWLAQAPGPKIPSESDIVKIGRYDYDIESSKMKWTDTWNAVWRGLSQDEALIARGLYEPERRPSSSAGTGNGGSGGGGGSQTGSSDSNRSSASTIVGSRFGKFVMLASMLAVVAL